MFRLHPLAFGTCACLFGSVMLAQAQDSTIRVEAAAPTADSSRDAAPAVAEPVFGLAAVAKALAAEAPETESPAAPADQADWVAERRACPGCPKRSVGRAIWQTTVVNILYGLANLARGQVTARVTPETWWDNMEQGWVWDLDDFTVNQVGHPYQGSNYYNAGRANGLGFYESAAIAAFGSSTWEYYGETNFPSLNDFINTTLGGIALGEMFHRTAWLVRNPKLTGGKRFLNEFGAMAIDPVTGLNRMIVTREAFRPGEKPDDMQPPYLGATIAGGVLWRGSQTRAVDAAGQPFLEADAVYGDPDQARSRKPYEAFTVRGRFGGGSAFSEARVRGRLYAESFANDKWRFSAIQSYDYQKNDAYATGAQSVEGLLDTKIDMSENTFLRLGFWGGLTVLGAVDSLPLGLDEVPVEEEEGHGDAGQGVSEGPRYYDYGPGTTFGGSAIASRLGRPFAVLSYEGRHIYSLDGVRANHLLQRVRLDFMVPVRGPFGIGVAGEYFDRRTWFQDVDQTTKSYRYPQLRAFLTWSH
jgi:hypothetical protein